jgi:hypothetical protein
VTQEQFLMDAAAWIINIIFWSGLVSPILVGTFWPWRESHWGQNIMSFDICVSLALLGSVIKHDWGFPGSWLLGFEWLELVSLSCIPVIIVWRTVMIWKRQRNALHEAPGKNFPEPPAEKKLIREPEQAE